MHLFSETVYTQNIPTETNIVFVGDIGGTNSTFAIVESKNNTFNLLVSLRYKSKDIDDFITVIKEALEHLNNKYKLIPTKACLGIAGVVSEKRDFGTITNLKPSLATKKIIQSTPLKQVHLMNDFEAIGYGIGISPSNYFTHVAGPKMQSSHQTRAVIGAGTGLGKTFLIWNKRVQQYKPHPSEGGHSDFPVQSAEELKLAEFICEKNNIPNVSWEDLLSGGGLSLIYGFLEKEALYETTEYTREITKSGYSPALISDYQKTDKLSEKTFELFTKFYARCAKNFALDTLARGGVYIAGGIAIKNIKTFETDLFKTEFTKSKKRAVLLKQIPICVINNYDIGLYGAAAYTTLFLK